MSGKTISNSETKIEALKLQSSAYGVTIPLVFGRCRISGNLLDYLGFQAFPHTETQGGKGGGVKVQNTTYTYTADVAMGLCHGPISEIPTIWRGKKMYAGGLVPTQIQTAVESYTPPGSGAMSYTTAHASAYLSIVSITFDTVGENEVGSYTYAAVLAAGTQYQVNAGVVTITDGGLRGVPLTITYQWASGTRPTSPMETLGLTFKPGTIGQTAWSALPGGRDVPYSGLALVAGQGYDLGTGAQVENHLFEVVGPMAYHLGATVPDVDPALMLRAALTQLQGGADFPPDKLDDWPDWSNYCRAAGILVSPSMTEQVSAADIVRTAAQLTNTAPVWSAGRLKMVPLGDQAETGNGATYTPNTTPLYDLDDESYTPSSSGGSPISVKLKSATDRKNHWRVEFLNRANQYNVEIAEAKDAADIDENGLRSADIVQAHWLCTPEAARKVAQILLQRSLYINAEYSVPLPWHYALIEPAELLTLTDTALQMDKLPVRVTVVEESEEGDLTISAEDYPPGTASPATYPSQAGSGYTANYNADPGSVDVPVIFEAPYTLAVTGLEVYAAVRGLSNIWGGYQVWVSLDGTSYKQAGTVYGPSRYGVLAAALTNSGASMQVSGLGANAQLLSGSAADAANLQTLCYLGGTTEEYVAHQAATLTGSGAYTLGGLVRGAHGTPSVAHASGAKFVRVDDRIAKSGALDTLLVGSTIYFKFTSFNIWGGGQQDLSAATAYPYTITGSMVALAPVVGNKPTIRFTPAFGLLTEDATGKITNFGAATSRVQVIDPSGADVTAAWTTTKADTGIATTLSSGTTRTLTVTGFSTAVVAENYSNLIILDRFNGGSNDESPYDRGAPEKGSLAIYETSGGPFTGTGYVHFPASASGYRADNKWIRYQGGNEMAAVDTNWSMSSWVRMDEIPQNLFPILGNLVRDLNIYGETWNATNTKVYFAARWFMWYPNSTGNNTFSVNIQTSLFTIATGVWFFIELAWDNTAKKMRLFLNGELIGTSTTTPSGICGDSPNSSYSSYNYWQDFKVGANYDGGYTYGLIGGMAEVAFQIGGSVPTASYTAPTAQRLLSSAPSVTYTDVTAVDGSGSTLTGRYEVYTQAGNSDEVLLVPSQASGQVVADWDGSNPDYSSAHVTFKLYVNGIDKTNEWVWYGNPDANPSDIASTMSNGVLTITGGSFYYPYNQSQVIEVLAGKAGYVAKTYRYTVSRILRPKPTQVATQTKVLIQLAGDSNGAVTDYTGASFTGAVSEGNVDKTTGYSWTRSATSGLTTTLSGSTVTVTGITNALDAGTITLTGTKTDWPTVTITCQVSKSRTLVPVGFVGFAPIFAYGTDLVTAPLMEFALRTNGTLEKRQGGSASWTAIGNWYSPTTTSIGSGYYVKAVGSAVAGGGYSWPSTWTSIASDVVLSITDGRMDADLLFSTSSTGATIAGAGTLLLISAVDAP